MNSRIAECRGIAAAEEKDCMETREATAAAERCTVATDVCSLTAGDTEIKATEAKKGAEEVEEHDCCCCDC